MLAVLTYPLISSSGPTRSFAPLLLATRMDSTMRSLLPVKSRAHWLRAQVATCIKRPMAEGSVGFCFG